MDFYLLFRKASNKYAYAFFTPLNKIYLKLNRVSYGKKLKVRGGLYIIRHSKNSKITVGNNVTFNSAGWANPIGTGNKTYFQLVDNGEIIIGNHCGISNTAFTSATKITLQDNVLLGSGCKIFDTDFHPLNYCERIIGNRPDSEIGSAPILIKEGAFVGAGSFILKGVTVGKHSIVGAGSVVTKNIPDYEIWAGNPAKFIGKVKE